VIKDLFARKTAPQPGRAPPRGAPGKRLYAIGDVHGRLDLLDDLLGQIERHAADTPAESRFVVLLGDLIDRGPCSKGVLERLRGKAPIEAKFVFVKGNHEELLADALRGDPVRLPEWLKYGGLECAQSYGVEVGGLVGASPDVIAHALEMKIPRSHLAFIDSFVDSVRFGDYLLVHAGVRPGVALDHQDPTDLRWIRSEFLASPADHGAVIVHGHSIEEDVQERANRIGIDTGAYRTGRLTALWIDGPDRGFLATPGGASG
jgi:serine/threonine protein phosphatase 1